jgi:dephospho-CoA kinase
MRVFGLTGGIGSGKSTVAARFRERGLAVVDADELARRAVEPGSDGLARVTARFGRDVLGPDGALDRRALARRVFEDQTARSDLNAIVHPRVRDLAQLRFAELARSGARLACYEVPLLVEVGLTELLRPLVVVSVPLDVQIARTMARDAATEAEVRARLAAQLPLADKVELADLVIDASGSIEQTRARADDVLDAVCRQLGLDPALFPRS